MFEFLEDALGFSLKQDLVYFPCHLLKSGYFFVLLAKKTGLHKTELLKYHESFPILVFKGSLSIEMAL